MTRFIGHHTNTAFYIIILLLLLTNGATLALHMAATKDLQSREREAKTALAIMESERDHYKEAYEIVLADAQALGRIRHVEYESDAGSAGQTGVRGVSGDDAEVQHLGRLDVWGFYNKQGIILDSCIPTTKVVQTPSDEVGIVVVAQSEAKEEPAQLRLLVDAQQLDTYAVTAAKENLYRTRVLLPKGTHYLDLLFDNAERSGKITISLVRIGDRTIENSISIIDEGVSFEAFDCEDTKQGATLARNGAMRFRIEKV